MTGFCREGQCCGQGDPCAYPIEHVACCVLFYMPMQPRQENIPKCSPDEKSSDPGVPNFCQVSRRSVQGEAYAEPIHHLSGNKHWECHCSCRQDCAHTCIQGQAPQRSQHAKTLAGLAIDSLQSYTYLPCMRCWSVCQARIGTAILLLLNLASWCKRPMSAIVGNLA